MGALANMQLVLAADVANNGTIASIAYPAGTSQAALTGSKGGQVVRNGDLSYSQAGGTVGFTFGATITITNTSGVGWKAGDKLVVSFGKSDNDGNYSLSRVALPSIAAPTGGATTDAEGRTAITAILAALVAAGIIQPSA